MLIGDFTAALNKFAQFYAYSSDITQLIADLMEITAKTTSVKLVKDYKLDGYSKFQQEKISEIANKISLASLTRIWQMLLKGNSEISFSNSQKMAFEMLLARICHMVALPNLKEALLDLNQSKNSSVVIEEKIAPIAKSFDSSITNQMNGVKEISDDVVNEILRNFEGSKIV